MFTPQLLDKSQHLHGVLCRRPCQVCKHPVIGCSRPPPSQKEDQIRLAWTFKVSKIMAFGFFFAVLGHCVTYFWVQVIKAYLGLVLR